MIHRMVSAIAIGLFTILSVLGVPSLAYGAEQLYTQKSETLQQPQSYPQEQYSQQVQSYQNQMPQQSQSLQGNPSLQDSAAGFFNNFVNQLSGKKSEQIAPTVQQTQPSPQNTAT